MSLPSLSTVVTLAVFALIALAVWWWLPGPRIVTITLIGLLLVLGPTLWWTSQRNEQQVERLTREGQRGTATILRVESTNVLNRDRPQVRLDLRVEVAGRPAYETQQLVVLPYGQSATPNRMMPVQVDPSDPHQMLIDWSTAPAEATPFAAGPSVAERLKQLDSLRDQNLITAEEYAAQRQRLLAEL